MEESNNMGSEELVEGELAAGWRGRVGELGGKALQAFWAEAVGYARWEIGQYATWRQQDEPVLADGYDAEGVVQLAFERLLRKEAGSVSIFYNAEDIRRELRRAIKHRVRWLHERSETRLTAREWDVLPAGPNGELVSVFDYLPAEPDEELMRRKREDLLEEYRERFEGMLSVEADGGDGRDLRRLAGGLEKRQAGGTPALPGGAAAVPVRTRNEMVEVFRRIWEGQKRREIAKGLGVDVKRVKALQARLRRQLQRLGRPCDLLI